MKYLIFILLLFISCEKESHPDICKECTMKIDYPEREIVIFACGDELKKIEQNHICKPKPSKQ